MEGDGWETVEYECQAEGCTRNAIGFLRVPVSIHPDCRFVVCEDHGDFVASVLNDVEYINWLDDKAQGSL